MTALPSMIDRSFADDTNGWENAKFFIEFKTRIFERIDYVYRLVVYS